MYCILLCMKFIALQMSSYLDPNNPHGCSSTKKTMQCLFEFLGCSFSGTSLEIETHLEECVKYHLLLVGKFWKNACASKNNGVANKDYKMVKQILHAEMK